MSISVNALSVPTGRTGLMAWAMYDWANSAFAAIIQTFVFAAYFTAAVAIDESVGEAQWGYTVSLSGLAVAVLSPVLGAIADQSGRRKPWVFGFTMLCVMATGMLWFIKPDPAYAVIGMVLAGMGIVGAEFATVFYNAMLPSLASPRRIGRWSGWAWALGYAGGLACLIIAVYGFVQRNPPPFGLDVDQREHVRATFILAAAWLLLFSLPLFLFTADVPASRKPLGAVVRDGLGQLVASVKHARRLVNLFRFIIARMIFIDGLTTIFAFGGVYAKNAMHFDTAGVIKFGIALNVTAGLAHWGFAWIDDWIGSKRTIIISLVGLIASVSLLLLTESTVWFWILGSTLGIFVGPVQAASRSFMARFAPPDLQTQMFGLLAFSGKATSFLGPLLVGAVAYATGSTRIGMSMVLVFLVTGLAIMLTVEEKPAAPVLEQAGAAG